MRLVFTLIFITNLYAAFETSNSNVFLNGTAHSAIATDQYFSAFLLNPAITATLSHRQLGISYNRPFGVSDLHSAAIITSIPINHFGLGFSFHYFGNSLYRENQTTFNLSRGFFNRRFFTGINLHWYSLNVENYGNRNSFGLDIGIQYSMNTDILVGFSLKNFNQPTINGKTEEIPLVTSWGIKWRIEKNFDVNLAFQKDSWFPISILFGAAYQANDNFIIQSGYSTYPALPSLGVSFKQNWVKIHYVFQYHFDLGSTHNWGISFLK